MITLNSFSPIDPSIQVSAGLNFAGEFLRLSFELKDPHGRVQDSLKPGQAASWPRADELWKTTCFECFLAVPGEEPYWEINLSPGSHRWAVYKFESYRAPQPPKASEDFVLHSVDVTESSLSCSLKVQIECKKLSAGLTAVIRTASDTLYYSNQHRPEKPDFHWREGYALTVQRDKN